MTKKQSRERNPEIIKRLVEEYVLPMYNGIEDAHGISHVRMVIDKSIKIAEWVNETLPKMNLDIDMVHMIAAWHDVGRIEDEKHPHAEDNEHEKVSARMFIADPIMKKWFDPIELQIMMEAIEDHRASNKHDPRTILGRVVADGDRYLDYENYWRRTITYKIKHWPGADREKIFQLAAHHLRNKYGKGGYLKLHLGYAEDVKILQQISERLACSDDELRPDFDRMYDEITRPL